jgi:translocation and assembly module TamB
MEFKQRAKAHRTMQRRWKFMLFRLSFVLGSSIALSGTMAMLWTWQWAEQYVQQQLAPLIADELEQSLNRPVILGAIEQISPVGLRLGASHLPATESDRDQVTMQAIDISFSLVDLLQGKLGLTVTLIKPHLFIDQDANGEWLNTNLVLQDEDVVEVRRIIVRDAMVTVAPFVKEAQPEELSHTLTQVYASVTLPQSKETIPFRLRGSVTSGGKFWTSGTFDLSNDTAKISVRLNQLALAPLSSMLPPGFDVKSGQLASRLTVELSATSPIALFGTAQLTDASARVPGEPNPFSDTSGKLRFQGQEIWIDQGTTRFGKIPFQLTGLIHLQHGLNLDAQVLSVSVTDFMDTFDLKLPVSVAGALKSDNLKVLGPFGHVTFSATVVDEAPISIDRITFARIRTEFTLDKQSDRLSLSNTELVPTVGGSIRGAAQIHLGDEDDAVITATMVDVPLNRLLTLYGSAPEPVSLGNLNATAHLKVTEAEQSTAVDWQLTQGHYPAAGVIAIKDDKIDFHQTSIRLPGGTVHARGTLVDQNWSAQLNVPGLILSTLSPDLTGTAKGVVDLAGNLRSLTPENITASGQVALSPDATPLAEPITAKWQWHGDRLHIQEAATPTMQLDGWLNAGFTEDGFPEITQVDLNLQVPNYDLAILPIDLPESIQLRGQSSLNGRIFGALDSLQLLGHLAVNDLKLNAIAFAPQMTGTVQFNTAQQGKLALSGGQDQIALQMNLPQARAEFQMQKEQAQLRGMWSQNKLQATVQEVPFTLLTSVFPVDRRLRSVEGLLSGTINADITHATNPRAEMTGSITNLAFSGFPDHLLSRHQSDRLIAHILYEDSTVKLNAADLFWGDSQLHLTGQFNPQPHSELSGEITLHHGELQDVATVFQWLNSQNIDILQRFTQQSSGFPQPVLASPFQASLQPFFQQSLQGTFAGQLQFRLAKPSELQATFALKGENWQLGEYQLDHLALREGVLSGTALTIDELQIQGISYNGSVDNWRSPDTTLYLNLAGQQQIAQVQVAQLPLTLLGAMWNSPFVWQGELGAIAHLDYSATSPRLTGELMVQQPQINDLVLNPFELAFSYQEGRVGIGTGITYPILPMARANGNSRIASLAGVIEFKQLNPIAIASVPEPFLGLSQTVVLTYGLFRPSFAIADLKNFVQTGETPSGWDIYFAIADLEPDTFRQIMTQSFTINVGLLDDLLNSDFGDTLLTPISQIIHTPSRQDSVAALKSALILSARGDHQISLLELLQNYPTTEVHIDLSQLASVMEKLSSNVE